jgi:hypothetical protein
VCKQARGGGGRHHFVTYQSDDDGMFNIDVAVRGNKPYYVTVLIDKHSIDCEIDTGSRISAISDVMYRKLFGHKYITKDNLMLRGYSGSRIESLGYIEVDVDLNGFQQKSLRLYVIKGGARPLLGREWMRALNVTQINLNAIIDDRFVNQLCNEFPEVFSDKLGTCKQPISLQLTDTEPVYVRARPVPLALRARVEKELNRLETDGSIYRVDHSDYGTPIVPVIKANGEIRICGDYKITINPKLKRNFYPLPRIDELFANLSGGERFTKIDLRHAYEQCLLEEASQPYTAITTHMGTFVYRRTPYGLSCIPEKFQKLMEEVLRGVPGCVVFLDDICVTGTNDIEHIKNLKTVLERLRDTGLTVKLSKCSFLQDSVNYLGFIINKDGLRPNSGKLEAISSAPRPENVSQLKSFLGMVNYYGRFIPNLSGLLNPLHSLLKKESDWKWNPKCERAFTEAKRTLLSDRVLAHYEEGRELVLSVDSSAYGLGAVLAHRYENGVERPVSCVSRTLSAPERNYSQLDKEALAILFGVTKHHQYLYGRRFTLRTDHQPLTYIFGEKGGIPQTAASRLQRWAARLAAYDFMIEFVRSADNGPADALSRLPLPQEGSRTDSIDYLNLVEEYLPICFKEVAKETEKDPVLCKIKGFVLFGWPPSGASCEELRPYFARKEELVVERGCLIYKYRIVVPQNLRKRVLEELHEGHLGMNKMKNLSRSYVYWPSLDRDIEEVGRACPACRVVRDAPPHAPLHPWEFPLEPWGRLHADFADCAGVRYLVLVDAHSKWIEVVAMRGTDAGATTKALGNIFAQFGLPSQLVTDNGPPFSSQQFKIYCKNNFIRHVTSAPYRPQGNGLAENAVKNVKKCIKRALHESEDVNTALNKFLLQYRNCDHATTGVSPAVALQRRRLRTRLDALRPDTALVVRAAQERKVELSGGTYRRFRTGDAVLARDYSVKGAKWAEGKVVKETGPVSYRVDVGNGVEWRRHADQLLPANGGNKGRYSLTRMTLTTLPEEPEGCSKDAEGDTFEDAFDEAMEASGSPAPRPEDSRRSAASAGAGDDIAIAEAASPLASSASARALRAYNRAKRTLNN